jgi:probable rRNA maturation factor
MSALAIQGRAAPGIDVEIEAEAWIQALANAAELSRQAAHAALGARKGGVVVLLTDDESVRELNARFRRQDRPTNVLAFPAPPGPGGHLGDIALAFGVCQAEARAQAKPLADHLRHLVVHGVLHLLGYDHQDEAEARVMEALETDRLAGMGVPDPYAPEPVDDVEMQAPSGG